MLFILAFTDLLFEIPVNQIITGASRKIHVP